MSSLAWWLSSCWSYTISPQPLLCVNLPLTKIYHGVCHQPASVSSLAATQACSRSTRLTYQPSPWLVTLQCNSLVWRYFVTINQFQTAANYIHTNTDRAARWSGGVPELHEDQRLRLVGHSSRGRGLSYHHYHCRCYLSCTIIIIIWRLCSRSGSPETGQATTVGKTDEATMLGTSEPSTPTWWAIA